MSRYELPVFCVALLTLAIILTITGTGYTGSAVILAVTVIYGITLGIRIRLTR